MVGRLPRPDAAVVLAQRHVHAPRRRVCDAPMVPYCRPPRCGRWRPTGEAVPDCGCALIAPTPFGFHGHEAPPVPPVQVGVHIRPRGRVTDHPATAACAPTGRLCGGGHTIRGTIRDPEADAVRGLKAHPPALHEAVAAMCAYAQAEDFALRPHTYHPTVDKGHVRRGTRPCGAIGDPEYWAYDAPDHAWLARQSRVMVQSERRLSDHMTTETRYFISCLPPCARTRLGPCGGHGHIENAMPWVRDVAFPEDDCGIRWDPAPPKRAILRRIALHVLQQEKATRLGITHKSAQGRLGSAVAAQAADDPGPGQLKCNCPGPGYQMPASSGPPRSAATRAELQNHCGITYHEVTSWPLACTLPPCTLPPFPKAP